MQITTERLRQIIKEELQKANLNEQHYLEGPNLSSNVPTSSSRFMAKAQYGPSTTFKDMPSAEKKQFEKDLITSLNKKEISIEEFVRWYTKLHPSLMEEVEDYELEEDIFHEG